MQVVDPAYRSARVLPSSRFVTDFRLDDLLDSVAALIGAPTACLTASLDKASCTFWC